MSHKEIFEAHEIINMSKDPDKSRGLIKTAIQSLLHHQIIYRDSHTISLEMYNFIMDNTKFFEKFFFTAGMDFKINYKLSMISISFSDLENENYGARLLRLKKDETIVRLTLKYLYSNGLKTGNMDENGRVSSNFVEIYNEYRRLSNIEPPKETYFKNNLIRPLVKRGCIKYSSDEDITILPGINIIVSDSNLNKIISESERENTKGEVKADV